MFLKSIYIHKLYDQFDYNIDLDFNFDNNFKILTAPNGFGKSTILRMIFDLFNNNLSSLIKEKFEYFILYTSYGEIKVNKIKNNNDFKLEILNLSADLEYVFDEQELKDYKIKKSFKNTLKNSFPFLVPISEDRWIDTRDDEILFNFEVEERFHIF